MIKKTIFGCLFGASILSASEFFGAPDSSNGMQVLQSQGDDTVTILGEFNTNAISANAPEAAPVNTPAVSPDEFSSGAAARLHNQIQQKSDAEIISDYIDAYIALLDFDLAEMKKKYSDRINSYNDSNAELAGLVADRLTMLEDKEPEDKRKIVNEFLVLAKRILESSCASSEALLNELDIYMKSEAIFRNERDSFCRSANGVRSQIEAALSINGEDQELLSIKKTFSYVVVELISLSVGFSCTFSDDDRKFNLARPELNVNVLRDLQTTLKSKFHA
jgi:hypothetical protein